MRTCQLPDTFQSWFLITHLHVWMCLVRLKQEVWYFFDCRFLQIVNCYCIPQHEDLIGMHWINSFTFSLPFCIMFFIFVLIINENKNIRKHLILSLSVHLQYFKISFTLFYDRLINHAICLYTSTPNFRDRMESACTRLLWNCFGKMSNSVCETWVYVFISLENSFSWAIALCFYLFS